MKSVVIVPPNGSVPLSRICVAIYWHIGPIQFWLHMTEIVHACNSINQVHARNKCYKVYTTIELGRNYHVYYNMYLRVYDWSKRDTVLI